MNEIQPDRHNLVNMRQFAEELIRRRNNASLVLTSDVREQRDYAAQLVMAAKLR
jgi:hypothetical protein